MNTMFILGLHRAKQLGLEHGKSLKGCDHQPLTPPPCMAYPNNKYQKIGILRQTMAILFCCVFTPVSSWKFGTIGTKKVIHNHFVNKTPLFQTENSQKKTPSNHCFTLETPHKWTLLGTEILFSSKKDFFYTNPLTLASFAHNEVQLQGLCCKTVILGIPDWVIFQYNKSSFQKKK